MSHHRFESLCQGLFQCAGVSVPELPEDNVTGSTAVHITLDGVEVVVSHEPDLAEDHALFAVTFGPLPQGRELDACKALMRMNVHGLPSRSVFGRNPQTGEIVLMQMLHQGQATAQDMY